MERMQVVCKPLVFVKRRRRRLLRRWERVNCKGSAVRKVRRPWTMHAQQRPRHSQSI